MANFLENPMIHARVLVGGAYKFRLFFFFALNAISFAHVKMCVVSVEGPRDVCAMFINYVICLCVFAIRAQQPTLNKLRKIMLKTCTVCGSY